MTTAPATRRRRLLDTTPAAPITASSGAQPSAPAPMPITDQLADLWELKVAADRAAKLYDDARSKFYARMVSEGRKEVLLPAFRQRPAVLAKETYKTTNTISPEGLRAMLDENEFLRCVKVVASSADALVAKDRLKTITTEASGNPYLDVRVAPKSRT